MENSRTTLFVFAVKKVFSLIIATALFLLININELKAEDGPVTRDQVIEYLEAHQITSVSCNEVPDSYDWVSTNSNGTLTRVFVVDGIIAGHENIDV